MCLCHTCYRNDFRRFCRINLQNASESARSGFCRINLQLSVSSLFTCHSQYYMSLSLFTCSTCSPIIICVCGSDAGSHETRKYLAVPRGLPHKPACEFCGRCILTCWPRVGQSCGPPGGLDTIVFFFLFVSRGVNNYWAHVARSSASPGLNILSRITVLEGACDLVMRVQTRRLEQNFACLF